MKKAAHVITMEKLEKQGWIFDHEALVNRYHYAGSVSLMKSRKGFDFCRVHAGKSVGERSYQYTYVMKRPVQ